MPLATRRTVLSGAVTGAAALSAAGYAATPAHGVNSAGKFDTFRLTVLGTTDLHGNVFNWDYYKNAAFSNSAGNEIGVAKVKTLIDAVREERRGEPILTIDAGDTIQGTPLAYYYARIDPITKGSVHPMARAMNLVGYDAAALGNHEFNYGIDTIRKFEEQVNFPMLGANAVDPSTKLPVFPPYIIKDYDLGRGRRLRVGVLGLTNPGIAIWDKAIVEGKMEFPGLVEQAKIYVPELKKAGCDLVIISAHSGADTSSSYGDELPPENAATLVAEQVPDVDAILVGHAHREITERFVTNAETGKQVLLTEPLYWGMRVSVMDLVVRREKGHGRPRWVLQSATSQTLNSNTVDADPDVSAAVQEQHDVVVSYVNSVVGTSAVEMLAARAVVEDVPIIDFVSFVQADAVKAALTGDDAALPVLSIAAPFSRAAAFPAGEVTVRDVAGLYIYDNTLMAVRITGAQLKDYLEFTARYFKRVSGTGPFPIADVTNAPTDTAPNGTPDYNFDTIAGLDAALTYDIDISMPVGSRVTDLAYDGVAVADGQEFVLAVNNYRQSGGGGFPHVTDATVVYNQQVEIRQLLIDWVTANQVIDPAAFASVDWRLVSGGEPITVNS
ncbi:5'-nucleotidase C-terminal domain-containing protein [Nocardioides sp. NPDC006273]|uniref:bifunctional metallophosphatase/5'-nucleotidase n=1 Tax=Nocardioides sp. NPDC006273 TaxID=3155598 RepID=UPI0033BDEB53